LKDASYQILFHRGLREVNRQVDYLEERGPVALGYILRVVKTWLSRFEPFFLSTQEAK